MVSKYLVIAACCVSIPVALFVHTRPGGERANAGKVDPVVPMTEKEMNDKLEKGEFFAGVVKMIGPDAVFNRLVCREILVVDDQGKTGVTVRAERGGHGIYIGNASTGPYISIYTNSEGSQIAMWKNIKGLTEVPFAIANLKGSESPHFQLIDKEGKVQIHPIGIVPNPNK